GYVPKPYIDLELQKGTTPLAKLMGGIATRNFQNFHHPDIQVTDFVGPRAILDTRYKLVIHDGQNDEVKTELFDIIADPSEANNLVDIYPEIAQKLEKQLRDWQQSVLESLIGNDYK